jgi:hypothetical protein
VKGLRGDALTKMWRRAIRGGLIKGLLSDFREGGVVSHPDLRTNPNARIHVRQDQVTHMHRRSEYQNTM